MINVKDLFAKSPACVLLDGAMGTELFAAGLKQGRAPEWWNLEHPDLVAAVNRSYAEAGSDIVVTNTFGGTPIKLATVGLEGRCAEINAAAVRLAREACGDKTLIAGDIGPSGEFLAPMGTATVEALRDAFTEQARALADAGADLLIVETMYDLREAEVATAAAAATDLPVISTMTFESKRRGYFTIMGNRIGPSLRALAEAGASAVGFNCNVVPKDMLGMVREANAEVDLPIVAQPNAGQPDVTADGLVYDAEPNTFAAELLEIVEAGARVVGGCCGTSPEFIRAARALLDAEAST